MSMPTSTKPDTEPRTTQERDDICQALAARASFYSMLGSLYVRPLTQEQIDHLADSNLSEFTGINENFDAGVNDIVRYLRRRNTGTREELAVDYTATFAGTSTWEGKTAVPFESVFTSASGLLCQESFHEVRSWYCAYQLSIAGDNALPDDHLGYMCEFMAQLSTKAQEALADGDADHALKILEDSRTFADEHITSWFGDLQQRALHIIKTRFYRGVLRISDGFFAYDQELLADLTAAIKHL
jgi:TorA maturation chaperone TorD